MSAETEPPAYRGPLPAVTARNRPYWDGLREHRLLAPRCTDCGHVWLPPGPWCPSCWSRTSDWVELCGRGTVTAWVRFHRQYFRSGAFEVPYAVAEVTLEEGPRLYAPLDGAEPVAGLAVEVVYDDVAPELTLARVRPVGGAAER